jgi:uncharacterized Zn finger protein (UPF0148 family)
MAITVFHPELAGANDCPFCGSNFLFFKDRAVACDRCQAEGPFFQSNAESEDEEKLECVRLWNLRPDSKEWDE